MRSASEVRSQVSPPTKKPSKNDKREAIGKQLKDAYQDVVNEPLPDAFEELLRQLDEKTGDSDKDA